MGLGRRPVNLRCRPKTASNQNGLKGQRDLIQRWRRTKRTGLVRLNVVLPGNKAN